MPNQITIKPITSQELDRYLSIPDLTLPENNKDKQHAVYQVYNKAEQAIKILWPQTEVRVLRHEPIVSTRDCYDNLLVPGDNLSRSSTYTHYVDEQNCLQTHTSAQIPAALRQLAMDYDNWEDVTLLVPGLAYRRDICDRTHLGVLHQMDIWRIVKNRSLPDHQKSLAKEDLLKMVTSISEELAPGWNLRIEDNPHPYTNEGIEVNAKHQDGRDIEILECGLLGKQIIQQNGMDPKLVSGLAAGLGLDRLVMTLKNIPDIRYLRSNNPRIAAQMNDLDTYKTVSLQPAITRDLSYCVPVDYVEEDVSQAIEKAVNNSKQNILESVELLSETNYSDLPKVAKTKLGINITQKNVLVRITLRDLNDSITNHEANKIYQSIYKQVNHTPAGYL